MKKINAQKAAKLKRKSLLPKKIRRVKAVNIEDYVWKDVLPFTLAEHLHDEVIVVVKRMRVKFKA